MAAEQLLLINPRRRSRARRRRNPKRRMPAGLRRYWAARRGTRLANPRRRKRRTRARRRNPIVHSYRRRRPMRAHARRRNPRRRSRSFFGRKLRRLRNPRGGVGGTLVAGLIGAGGALALNLAFGYINPYLPANLQTGLVQTAVLGVGALALGWGIGRVMGDEVGNDVAFGGLAVVLYNALSSIAQGAGFSTTNYLAGYADYRPHRIGAYMPGAMPMTAGFGARRTLGSLGYTSPAPVLRGLGAYMPRRQPARMAGLGAYMQPSGPMNVAPSYPDGM